MAKLTLPKFHEKSWNVRESDNVPHVLVMPVVDDHPRHVNASKEMAKDLDETEIVVEKKKRRFRRIKS